MTTVTSRLQFADLVDVPRLQELLDSCHRVIGVANAVIDADGQVLASAGWQSACTGFHRVNPATCARCIESDTSLVASMTQGEKFAVYRCLNGLVDTAAPIVVDGQHLANVFTGQFLTAPPDLEFFRRQARDFGFDEPQYLSAIASVPVISRERVEAITQLYANLASTLARNGMDRLRMRRATDGLQRFNEELERRVATRTAELAQSEERMRLAMLAARLAWFEMNLRTGEVAVSPEYVRMLGFDPATYRTSLQHWRDSLPPEEREDVMEKLDAGFRSGGPVSVTWRRLTRAGDWLWIHSVGEVVERDCAGEPVRVIGVHSDISERKRAEGELERYRQRLEDLVEERTAALRQAAAELATNQFALDRVGIGITWNDAATGRMIYVNDEACRQLGYSRAELLRLTISDVNPDFPREAVQGIAQQLRESGKETRIETVQRRRDGSTYPLEVTTILDTKAEPERFIAFLKDITQQKAAERELIQARDAAESASRAKNAFLATMSHELRTPLNAIIGFSSVMLDGVMGEVPPDYERPLGVIRRSGRELLELVQEILDMTSIEAGNLKVELAPVKLRTVLEEQCESQQVVAMDRKLEMRCDLCDESVVVVADRDRLSKVLRNLVSNAIKFTDAGSVRVSTAIEPGLVRVEVRDTGIGISAEAQSRLFQPFERVRARTGRMRPGTGLGLTISKRIVEAMGGTIGFESEPGCGSRFWFTIPLAGPAPAVYGTPDAA